MRRLFQPQTRGAKRKCVLRRIKHRNGASRRTERLERSTTVLGVECNQNFVPFPVLYLQHEAHQNMATDDSTEETPVLSWLRGREVRIVYLVLIG